MSRIQSVAGKIVAAKTEKELTLLLADNCRWLFDATSLVVMLSGEQSAAPTFLAVGTPDVFVAHYESGLHRADPVQEQMRNQQIATRDLDVFTRERWLAIPAYRELAMPCGLVRCMQGPIVGDGRIIGTIGVGRSQDAEFSTDDVATLSSLCTHVSVQLARLRSLPLGLARLRQVLTEREVEVSLLVAKGLTNEQIGHALGVSMNAIKGTLGRAFRRLEIESRVELVAILFDGL